MRILLTIFFFLVALEPGAQPITIACNAETGQGFVFAQRADTFYLLTAKHVVEGDNGRSYQEVFARLDSSLVQIKDVRTHPHHDLAFGYIIKTNFKFQLYCARQVEIYDKVYYYKKGKRIEGEVEQFNGQAGIIYLAMEDVEEGDSGSPIFFKEGLAGIIITNGEVQALSITRITEILAKEWAFPHLIKNCK